MRKLNVKLPADILKSIIVSLIVAVVASWLSHYFFIRQYRLADAERVREKRIELLDRFIAKTSEIDALIRGVVEHDLEFDIIYHKYRDTVIDTKGAYRYMMELLRIVDKKYPELSSATQRFHEALREREGIAALCLVYFDQDTTHNAVVTYLDKTGFSDYRRIFEQVRDAELMKKNEDINEVKFYTIRDSVSKQFTEATFPVVYTFGLEIFENKRNDYLKKLLR